MAFLLRSIFLLAALPGGSILGTLGENCILSTAKYIELPLGSCNISDSDGQAIHSWGAEVAFAGQLLCVEMSTVTNNFRVISKAVCDLDRGNTTTPQCASQRGGLFQTADNSTFNYIPISELVSDSGWDEWNNSAVAVHGELEMSDIALPMNIGVITNGINFTAGHLPLTNQSLLLQTLVDNGFIAERAFGIKIGTQIMTNPQGGTMILGAYDRGSLGGPFMNFSMNYPITPVGGDRECPIQVTIKQLLYQSPTQGVKLLLGNGQEITACIEPRYDVKFRFNEPILSLLMSDIGLTQTFTIQNSSFLRPEPGLLVPNNITFDGSFAFQLANGNESFSVNIPNEELYGPVTGIASDGSITSLTNANVSEIGVYSTPAPRNTAVLGRIFLSQVYLYVNYDQNQFSLAQAGAGIDSVFISSSNIIQCPTSGLESGSIVAIVVGVIVFLLIPALLLLLWQFYKFWKKQKAKAIVKNEESIRKGDVEMRKRDTIEEREESVKVKKESVNVNKESVNGKPLELSGAGTSTELSSESKNGHITIITVTQSQSSENTGIASYDLRSEHTRHLSMDTTMTGSAANGEGRPSELPVNSMQSPSSPLSPTTAADINEQSEE